MCFLPATLEIIGMVVLAPILFEVSILEAAIMGAVVAAVSPAVIVPKMIKLIEVTIAAMAILITAPLGAFLIELSYKKLLEI